MFERGSGYVTDNLRDDDRVHRVHHGIDAAAL
jgi:hypothetical protein